MSRRIIIAATAFVLGATSPVYADTVTFGQFLQKDTAARLLSPQDAHLSIDFLSNGGTTGTGTDRVQAFASGTISIVRDIAAAEGLGTRTNLLSISFTNAELDAAHNAGSFV